MTKFQVFNPEAATEKPTFFKLSERSSGDGVELYIVDSDGVSIATVLKITKDGILLWDCFESDISGDGVDIAVDGYDGTIKMAGTY